MSSSPVRLAAITFLLSLVALDARAELLTGLTIDNRLVTFDSNAPGTFINTQTITGLQPSEFVLGIDLRPATGQLYGVGSSNRLYTINAATGEATPVGSAGNFALGSTGVGFDFNPTVDRIRVTTTTDQNFRLNPNNGAVAGTDTALAYVAGDPNAGTDPNIVGSAYTNNFAGAATTTLYGIDSNLDTLVLQGGVNGTPSPNGGLLTTVGQLGFNTGDLVGFDISGSSGIAYASLTAPGAANFSQLFTINLSTGATTLIGSIGVDSPFNAPLRGLAAVPEPSAVALLGVGVVGMLAYGRRRVRRP